MSADIIALRPGKAAPSLDPLLSLTADGMNSVNAVILDKMQSRIPLIPSLAGHLIAGGGKRMRPMLTLAGAAICDYQGTRHHKLAAAVEFIREGKFGQLELLDAERTLAETRLAAIDALLNYHNAQAQLERLTVRAPDLEGN